MIATNGYLPIILHYCFPVNNKKRIDLSPIPRYNEKCRGDVPKWLKGPHSKCGRSGNRRESSNLSISVTNATEEGCEVYFEVTIQKVVSREVFWHVFAKIPRHTSQNAITEGDLKCILTRNCEGTEQLHFEKIYFAAFLRCSAYQ